MSRDELKEKPLSDVQKKIIQVSSKRFAKNGFQKTSLGEIAKAAKISKGTLFYHYPSKEKLFFVVLSHNIEKAFEEEFNYYSKQGFKLFQDREKLFDDLTTYYEARMEKPKLIDKLWLEGVIESQHNPKLQQMILEKDDEIAHVTAEMLKLARTQMGLLVDFEDDDILDLAKGLAAFFRGIFLYKIAGKKEDEIKNIWVKTVYNLYTAKRA